MSKKAPTFGEEMNCEKYVSIKRDIMHAESPVDKSFYEGECMQDTTTAKLVNGWFGMLPQSAQSVVGKDVPDCT
ncbi:MAG: hypothetical protein ACP5UZ_00285 [Thermoplasmata archaeon]